MRLPNGYGSVYKLSGNRRKPWIARKSKVIDDGELEKGKQIFETIGTYETKQKALQALAKYNEDPYDLHTDTISFKEVYDKWSEEHFQTIVPSAARTWKSAYSHCKPIHNKKMNEIRVADLEGTIRDATVGGDTKMRMKSLFNMMFKYSMKHEIVDKNYAELCFVVKKERPSKEAIPFSENEISLLWNNLAFPFVDMVLIGIYSGWRPQELAILKTADIDLENNTMFGGIKTDAGKNRYVPIHPKILNLVKSNYNQDNEYLFNDENGQQGQYMTYDKYRKRFNKVMEKLKLKHRPHETRHTFITLAKQYMMDEYILKLIVGHAIEDITEKVYTHRTMEQLQQEIIKIK
jgi:integrase